MPREEQKCLLEAFRRRASFSKPRDDSPEPAERTDEEAHPQESPQEEIKIPSDSSPEEYVEHASDLVECLEELGLKATNEVEKKEIVVICNEVAVLASEHVSFISFVFDLVPRVRLRLREMRRGPLSQHFSMYDVDESGFLDEGECTLIIDRLCSGSLDPEGNEEMRQALTSLFGELCNEAEPPEVDFEGFETLFERVQEHYQRVLSSRMDDIMEKRALTPAMVKQHLDELICLHYSFCKADDSGDGLLDKEEIHNLLIEFDLLPHEEADQTTCMDFFDITDKDDDGMINFGEFLRLVRIVRSDQLSKQAHVLMGQFQRYDRDRSGVLNITEISALLLELGLQPRCREDQTELKRLLDEIDTDKTGDFEFAEFEILVQRTRERVAAGKRREQTLIAIELGFEHKKVAELRDVFFNLDSEGAGKLGITQLRSAVTALRLPISAEKLQAIFKKVDVDGSGVMDFGEFLRFFNEIQPAKPAEAPLAE